MDSGPNVIVEHLISDKINVLVATKNTYVELSLHECMDHADCLKLGISKVKAEWIDILDLDFMYFKYFMLLSN